MRSTYKCIRSFKYEWSNAFICAPHINALDHSYLNEIIGLENPTSENIAIWLWNGLKDKLQNLSSIEVMETCNSGCEYSG